MGSWAAKYKARLLECIRHFTPGWFAVIMGTGVISILWQNSPYGYGSRATEILAYLFFFLNLFLFAIFNVLTALRYIFYPEKWQAMMRHPTDSLFLGTYPMGATTLINVAVGVIYTEDHFGGKPFIYTLWVFWWLDVAMSLLCAFGVVHLMWTRQRHTLESMTTVFLLPVVTLIVVSSTGAVLATPLLKYSLPKSLVTLAFSMVMVTMGLALAFMILSLYFLRLVLHGIPRGGGVVTVYIPLGPLGQSGYCILLLGAGFKSILPLHYGASALLRSEVVGQIVEVVSLCVAFVLWSMATMWCVYAVLATVDIAWHDKILFKQAFWSLIFPNGVYANLTIQLYRVTDGTFFRVWGAIYALAVLLAWTAVFVRTCMLVYSGAMFRAPCLDDIDIHAAMVEGDPELIEKRSAVTDVEAARKSQDGGVRMDGGADAGNGYREGSFSASSGRRTVTVGQGLE